MSWQLLGTVVFGASVAALVYTYIGYPVLLFLFSRIKSRPILRRPFAPSVTVIITAYNEERALAAKLENTLALDYPRELIEVIVASDCSTDRTDEIARSFSARGVRLHRQAERLGKTAAQNVAVQKARGEIIVFSDATSHYQPDVLREIMANFADATVGCVAGRLVYVDRANTDIGRGARSYWSYESLLKRHESRATSLIGASGCLYAVRKSAYVPLYHEACSDFIIATKMVEQGLRAVYEPNAVCTEETNRRSDNEFNMRVRVIAQTYTDLWRHRYMLNPLRHGFYAVQLLSHKVMRYAAPLFLLAAFGASAMLAIQTGFWRVVFLAQLGGYLAASVTWILERAGLGARLLALPHYFLLANVASAIAFYHFLRGNRFARWEPIRETATAKQIAAEGVKAPHLPERA